MLIHWKKQKAEYLKSECFFLNCVKLNYSDYVEKNKEINKAHVLAGAECSYAKLFCT